MTRSNSLFALLEEHPEFRNIILSNLLFSRPLQTDTIEALRKSISEALELIHATSPFELQLQRNVQLYGTPYDRFRPYGLRDNVDLIGLAYAIYHLAYTLTTGR
jgi:hypothetical protein